MGKLAGWRVLVITGGGFVVFAAAIFATPLPFSIAEVTSHGRDAYRNLQVADLFYLLPPSWG